MQRFHHTGCQVKKELLNQQHMKAVVGLLVLALFIGISGCSKNNNRTQTSLCDKNVLISSDLYNSSAANNYMITAARVNGDCLEVTFGASGCSGQSWIVELVDSEVIAKSNPPQRMIKLVLTNNELCAAAFTRTVSFDLTPLRVQGSDRVQLFLHGLGQQLFYNY
jgi:hypothetical protein